MLHHTTMDTPAGPLTIVVSDDGAVRGSGFTSEVDQLLTLSYGLLALEVNLVPRNDASLAFHAGRGYVEVGRLGDEKHLVSMMEKTL